MVEKKQNNGVWKYFWTAGGMLKAVQRPDGSVISFKYDAFGRRIEKKNARATTHFVWDGNVPLHEWKTFDYRETIDNDYVTWVFQDFVPVAKLQGGKTYSIISDHLGTPLMAIDTQGYKVWERELDIYGKVRKETKENSNFVPFRYQGQYYDNEVDLCYNRFRYYDCNTGSYISQDPIGLAGGLAFYTYVHDVNSWVDILGLVKYIVYQAPELDADGYPTGKLYTGRTKGDDEMSVRQILNKRKSTHHRKDIGNLVSIYETDNYDAMRGGEQYYLEEARNSDVAVDQINGISPKNKKKDKYKKAFANPKNDKTGKLDNNLKNSCK